MQKQPVTQKMTTIIDIHLRDGRTISGRADFGKGSPEYPYSYAEVAMKFQTCAEFAQWPKDKAKRVISLVDRLETLENLGELIASLVR
jgi:2-methylcitrate dehydratase PrpD